MLNCSGDNGMRVIKRYPNCVESNISGGIKTVVVSRTGVSSSKKFRKILGGFFVTTQLVRHCMVHVLNLKSP